MEFAFHSRCVKRGGRRAEGGFADVGGAGGSGVRDDIAETICSFISLIWDSSAAIFDC